MIKKIILLTVISSFSPVLFSYAAYACPFLLFNQSLSNAAFGLESGTADIRHLDASSYVNNPAKLGLIRGCSVNYSKSDYYYAEYRIMKIAFNSKGIGISLPMYDFDTFGYRVTHPRQLITDDEGNQYDSFQPEESALSFSIGLDSSTLFNSEELFFNSFNFYFGSTVNVIKSKIAPPGMGASQIDEIGHGTQFDFGSLVTYQPQAIQKQNSKLKFAFGTKSVVNNNIHYIDKSKADPLPQYTSIGFASDYSSYGNHPIFNETREKFHLYSSIDFRKYNIDRSVIGGGIEFGYLDLLSYRLGYTFYSDSETSGVSHSLGLNVILNSGLGFSTNYLTMLKNNELGYKDRLDFSLKYGF